MLPIQKDLDPRGLYLRPPYYIFNQSMRIPCAGDVSGARSSALLTYTLLSDRRDRHRQLYKTVNVIQ